MTVYEKNGKYYCRFQIDGERHHYLCNGAGTVKEAKKIEDGFKYKLQQQQNGVLPKNTKKVKLKILYDLYENYSKRNKRSYSRDISFLRVLKTYFNENIYAQNLKLSNFEDFKLKLQEERKSSNATVNKYLNILSKMYNLGIGDKLLTENPLTGVKKFRESNYKIRYLTREEEERMYRVMDEKFPYLKPIVVTALQTGMRRGEIFNLKWENIDFKYGFIELLETKSGKARKIPISDKLKNIFNNLQTKIESEYVFINPETGKPYRDIHKKFHIILEEAGIKNFRFHDLRHTVATRLVEKGIDLVVVKEILGHSSIETTMRYAHAVPERKLKAIEILNSYS